MNYITIDIPGQVKRKYPVPESFTYRELGMIKNETGLRPGDFEEALATGDPDIVISLAVVCAQRAGHKITRDDLLDLDVGAIMTESDDEDPTLAGVDEETPATILEDGGTQPSDESTD